MRRPVLAAAAATALLVLALPSSAEDAVVEPTEPTGPVPTEACAPVEGATVIGPEAVAPQTVAAPVLPNAAIHDANAEGGLGLPEPEQSVVSLDFVVDASGGDGSANAPVDATRAAVDLRVDWDGDAGDFDVYLTDAETGNELGSGTSFNPLDGAGEAVGPVTVKHCTVVTLRIENYAGVPGTELTVSAVRGRLRV